MKDAIITVRVDVAEAMEATEAMIAALHNPPAPPSRPPVDPAPGQLIVGSNEDGTFWMAYRDQNNTLWFASRCTREFSGTMYQVEDAP